jgi:hypothetical protein
MFIERRFQVGEARVFLFIGLFEASSGLRAFGVFGV